MTIRLMTATGHANQLAKIRELEADVRRLQSQVGDVTTQSSETWHDNAPYSILVEELRMADRRLSEAHNFLNDYVIRDYPTVLMQPIVQYGTSVALRMDGKPHEFAIVGYGEDDFDRGHIVYECPIARVITGRHQGEEFRADINRTPRLFYIERVTLFVADKPNKEVATI
jgi:transcription elongation GreA/GreB family factor